MFRKGPANCRDGGDGGEWLEPVMRWWSSSRMLAMSAMSKEIGEAEPKEDEGCVIEAPAKVQGAGGAKSVLDAVEKLCI